ncbi:MAG: hypothetical protein M3P45_11885 [Acidobacteriota bacterium]|nr:hypothetical protein [Acidobacteriota bacterium]
MASEILRTNGTLRLGVTGSSMLPALWPGDVLVIRTREFNRVAPGAIAVFSCHDRLVTHRVKQSVFRAERPGEYESQVSYLVTQGDTIPLPDPPITSESLLGVVVSVERGGKIFAPPLRTEALARFTSIFRRFDFALYVWLGAWMRVRPILNQMKSQLRLSLPSFMASP